MPVTNDHRVMGADNTSGSGAVGLAMLPNVHRIIGTCHFVLTLSQQRYGWAYAAMATPTLHDAAWLDDELNGADVSAVELQMFLAGRNGSRFPLGLGDTPDQALAHLDAVLARVSEAQAQDWSECVRDTIDAVRAARKQHEGWYYLDVALKAGQLRALM